MSASAAAAPSGKPVNITKAPSGAGAPTPPTTIRLAAGALVLSGVAALAAAVSLLGARSWLKENLAASNAKAKPPIPTTAATLHSDVNRLIQGQLIANAVLLGALILLAMSVWRGRHWSRWAVLILFVLGSFTGTLAGVFSLISAFTSGPVLFHAASFVAAAALVSALILVNIAPSAAYLALSRPARGPGGAGRPGLRDLFAPRGAASAKTPPARPAVPRSASNPSSAKQRAKVRADEAAVAKGAELARTRAKASKSRRTDA